MENKSTGLLVAAFVLLIMGAALITTVASEEQKLVKKISVVDTINFTSAREADGEINITDKFNLTKRPISSWKGTDEDCFISNYRVTNNTNATSNLFTDTTDYVIDIQNGTISFKDTDKVHNKSMNNISRVEYNYCDDNYLSESWTRSISDLIAGFFAIALMVSSVGLFYSVAKSEGWLNQI